jgi:hypothetical protein
MIQRTAATRFSTRLLKGWTLQSDASTLRLWKIVCEMSPIDKNMILTINPSHLLPSNPEAGT